MRLASRTRSSGQWFLNIKIFFCIVSNIFFESPFIIEKSAAA
jgi:hypothetical protein